MKRSIWFGLILIMIVLGLSACERSASVAPTGEASGTEVGSAAELISKTQTAMVAAETAKVEEKTEVPTATVTSAEDVATATPIPPTAAPIIIPTLTRPAAYTLMDQEHPYCIARRFNIDIGELLSLNDMTTFSVTAPGTVLKIPTTGHPWSSGQRYLIAHPATHTVAAGETIYTIACKYGDVTPEAIIAANTLVEPYTLAAGQALQIP